MASATEKATAGHDLHRQIEAARTLLANFRDILGDDEQAIADTVEGETNLHQAIERGIARIAEIEAMEGGLAKMQETLKSRCDRLKQQRENLRTSLAVAMEVAALKRLETALATITLKPVPAKVEITDEAAIPSKYWKPQEPKLDKKSVLDALKNKEDVPGAVLSNGGAVVSLLFK
jgi:acyl transferase domain-containing protein